MSKPTNDDGPEQALDESTKVPEGSSSGTLGDPQFLRKAIAQSGDRHPEVALHDENDRTSQPLLSKRSRLICQAFYGKTDRHFSPMDSDLTYTEFDAQGAKATFTPMRMRPYYPNISLGVISEEEWPCKPPEKKQKVEVVSVGGTAGALLKGASGETGTKTVAEGGTTRGVSTTAKPNTPPARARRGGRQRRGDPERASNNESKSSSRVGSKYQVSSLPIAGAAVSEDYGGQLLWDPVAANQASETGLNLDRFLDVPLAFPAKMLVLEALHDSGYDTKKAMHRFVQLVQKVRSETNTDPQQRLTEDQEERIEKLFLTQPRKDFYAISREMGFSVDYVLVQYYGWKGGKKKEYKAAKKRRKKESDNDYCEICDDGGTLILCDLCRKAYHMECLNPPLKKVPEGVWYCDNCIVRSPARVRSLHRDRTPDKVPCSFPSLDDSAGASQDAKRPVAAPSFEANLNDGVQKKRTGGKADEDISPGELYIAEIPNVSSRGLLVSVGYDEDVQKIVFLGYRRMSNDMIGYAEAKKVFKGPGDIVCAVNDVKVEGLSWEEASPVFNSIKNKRSLVRFVMRRSDHKKSLGHTSLPSTNMSETRAQVDSLLKEKNSMILAAAAAAAPAIILEGHASKVSARVQSSIPTEKELLIKQRGIEETNAKIGTPNQPEIIDLCQEQDSDEASPVETLTLPTQPRLKPPPNSALPPEPIQGRPVLAQQLKTHPPFAPPAQTRSSSAASVHLPLPPTFAPPRSSSAASAHFPPPPTFAPPTHFLPPSATPAQVPNGPGVPTTTWTHVQHPGAVVSRQANIFEIVHPGQHPWGVVGRHSSTDPNPSRSSHQQSNVHGVGKAGQHPGANVATQAPAYSNMSVSKNIGPGQDPGAAATQALTGSDPRGLSQQSSVCGNVNAGQHTGDIVAGQAPTLTNPSVSEKEYSGQHLGTVVDRPLLSVHSQNGSSQQSSVNGNLHAIQHLDAVVARQVSTPPISSVSEKVHPVQHLGAGQVSTAPKQSLSLQQSSLSGKLNAGQTDADVDVTRNVPTPPDPSVSENLDPGHPLGTVVGSQTSGAPEPSLCVQKSGITGNASPSLVAARQTMTVPNRSLPSQLISMCENTAVPGNMSQLLGGVTEVVAQPVTTAPNSRVVPHHPVTAALVVAKPPSNAANPSVGPQHPVSGEANPAAVVAKPAPHAPNSNVEAHHRVSGDANPPLVAAKPAPHVPHSSIESQHTVSGDGNPPEVVAKPAPNTPNSSVESHHPVSGFMNIGEVVAKPTPTASTRSGESPHPVSGNMKIGAVAAKQALTVPSPIVASQESAVSGKSNPGQLSVADVASKAESVRETVGPAPPQGSECVAAATSRQGWPNALSQPHQTLPMPPKRFSNGSKIETPEYIQYVASIPVTHEGLCLIITEIDGRVVFDGYSPFADGSASPIMSMDPLPFKNKGDEVVAIDNVPVDKLDYDEVIKLLKNHGSQRFRHLRMRTRTKTSS